MLRFIVILLLIYLFYRVARAILFPGKKTTRFPRQKTSGDQVIDEMVKDPVCGIYVPKREALTASHGGETIYFCSPKCRERYLEAKKGQVS
jgi:uncharacterized protein